MEARAQRPPYTAISFGVMASLKLSSSVASSIFAVAMRGSVFKNSSAASA